jgi:4-amino-4-deoxy-L-arabinose transferase-like glycosyltransferase
MKRWIAGLLVFLIPVLIWAQNASTPQPEKTEIPADSTKSLAVATQNEPQNETEKEEFGKGYNNGFEEGRMRGSQQSQSAWLIYGAGGGFLLGCLGAGGVWLLANSSGDYPLNMPNGDSQYRDGFINGYLLTTKSDKAGSACTGGIFGTLLATGILLMIYFKGF